MNLEVVETKEEILFKPKLRMLDLVGSGVKYAVVEEMNKILDKLQGKRWKKSKKLQCL